MQLRPRSGDDWEFKLPGKSKKVKRIGYVMRRYISVYDESGNWKGSKRIVYVNWQRLPKGRYSGIRVKTLMKHGKRICTRKEREARSVSRRASTAASVVRPQAANALLGGASRRVRPRGKVA
jgi:hypothetical protein